MTSPSGTDDEHGTSSAVSNGSLETSRARRRCLEAPGYFVGILVEKLGQPQNTLHHIQIIFGCSKMF